MTARPLVTALIALALTGTLAACGSDDEPAADSAPAADAPSDSMVSVVLGPADVEFAQGMIAHHEQAIEMSEIALDPASGASADVVVLATRIRDAQEPEVELMTAWLTAAGASLTMDTSDGHDMSSMAGMMTVEQLDALAAAEGAEFDRMWLEMMIEHHEGAISQATAVEENGTNADVLRLAEQIITTQQAEIDEMQSLLGS